MYTALDLAKYVVTKCTKEDAPISNLQLQKILYYIQKTFLQERHVRGFSDEIEAWQFGPVVPNVYFHFSGFGAMPISMEYIDVDIDPLDASLINPLIEDKRKLNPWELVEETHKPGGAWQTIYDDFFAGKVIPIELIQKD